MDDYYHAFNFPTHDRPLEPAVIYDQLALEYWRRSIKEAVVRAFEKQMTEFGQQVKSAVRQTPDGWKHVDPEGPFINGDILYMESEATIDDLN